MKQKKNISLCDIKHCDIAGQSWSPLCSKVVGTLLPEPSPHHPCGLKSHSAREAKEAEQEAGSRASSISTFKQKRFLQKSSLTLEKPLLFSKVFINTTAKAVASTQRLCTQLCQLGQAPILGNQSTWLFLLFRQAFQLYFIIFSSSSFWKSLGQFSAGMGCDNAPAVPRHHPAGTNNLHSKIQKVWVAAGWAVCNAVACKASVWEWV